jgi:renalase
MTSPHTRSVAIVGAGMTGATLAQVLLRAGHPVQVFDKSRGPGGRLATRRLTWTDTQGQAAIARLDHGALALQARTDGFRRWVAQARHDGLLADWSPRLAPSSLPLERDTPWAVPTPDQPSLCRHLLQGATTHWSATVDTLHPSPAGWQLQVNGQRLDTTFGTVVLALPPAQAAPLLGPHRPDWARHASLAPMQPCWTVMGVAADPVQNAPAWDLAQPATGPLAWAMRSDSRPGRTRVPGQAHWVLHARAGWSRRHLEEPAEWVQQQLQAALADWLGRPVAWLHGTAHRWRYALPQAQLTAPADACWVDAGLGLGVCGDFLGGHGVEGAWLSAQALAASLLAPQRPGAGRAHTLAVASP